MLLAVVIVIVELPPSLVTAVGENAAVAPDGNPLALKVTCWAELPVVRAVLIVDGPDVPPCVAVTDAGFADTVNALSVTVSATVVV
ncbi:MAG TPA: hypothetical protein VKB75_09075 [Jatrophihabitans sp.]|nr:hypothetical protein [Jatrophihabitans sp.]